MLQQEEKKPLPERHHSDLSNFVENPRAIARCLCALSVEQKLFDHAFEEFRLRLRRLEHLDCIEVLQDFRYDRLHVSRVDDLLQLRQDLELFRILA